MRKYLILSLIGITLLSGCQSYNDSFHKEFYDKTNKSYQTFEGEYNITPGVSHGDVYYSYILNSYFSNTQDIGKLKTLTYKKRSGYTGIYFACR